MAATHFSQYDTEFHDEEHVKEHTSSSTESSKCPAFVRTKVIISINLSGAQFEEWCRTPPSRLEANCADLANLVDVSVNRPNGEDATELTGGGRSPSLHRLLASYQRGAHVGLGVTRTSMTACP